MRGWKLFTFIFCQIDITLAHLSSAYSLSLQERKSSFPSIFINGCQGYVSGALLRDNFFKIKILFTVKLHIFLFFRVEMAVSRGQMEVFAIIIIK